MSQSRADIRHPGHARGSTEPNRVATASSSHDTGVGRKHDEDDDQDEAAQRAKRYDFLTKNGKPYPRESMSGPSEGKKSSFTNSTAAENRTNAIIISDDEDDDDYLSEPRHPDEDLQLEEEVVLESDDSQQEGWFYIRGIIAERKKKSKLYYKVSWAANPKTGKEYPNSWILSTEVTQAALDDWREKKALKRKEDQAARRQKKQHTRKSRSQPAESTRRSISRATTEDSSQSVVPAHSRKRSRAAVADTNSSSNTTPEASEVNEYQASSQYEPAPKRQRSDHYSSAAGPWSSATNEPDPEPASPVPGVGLGFYVGIPSQPLIDTTEYQSVYSSSQESSSGPLSQQSEEADESVLPSTEFKAPIGELSQRTIPDSQDPDDSAASYPSGGFIPLASQSQAFRVEIGDSAASTSLGDSYPSNSYPVSSYYGIGSGLRPQASSHSQIPSAQLQQSQLIEPGTFVFTQLSESAPVSSGLPQSLQGDVPPSSFHFQTQIPASTLDDSAQSNSGLENKNHVSDSIGTNGLSGLASQDQVEVPQSSYSQFQHRQEGQAPRPQLADSLVDIGHISSFSDKVVPGTVLRQLAPATTPSFQRSGHHHHDLPSSPTRNLQQHSSPSIRRSSPPPSTPCRPPTSSRGHKTPSTMDQSSSSSSRRSAVDILSEIHEGAFDTDALFREAEASVQQAPTDAAVAEAVDNQTSEQVMNPTSDIDDMPPITAPEVINALSQDVSTESLSRSGELSPSQALSALQPIIEVNAQAQDLTTIDFDSHGNVSVEPAQNSSLDDTPTPALGEYQALNTNAANPTLPLEEPIMSGAFLEPDSTIMPSTVSPSEISRSVEPETAFLPPLPAETADVSAAMHDAEVEEALPRQSSSPSPSVSSETRLGDIAVPIEGGSAETNKYVATLQLPSNMKQLYQETIMKYKTDIQVFTTRESDEGVDLDIVARVDQLFNELFRICDFPAFIGDVELRLLSSTEIMKHATGTNSKLFFVRSFFESLLQSSPFLPEKKVLLVAQSQELLGYLEAIVSSFGTIAYWHAGSADGAVDSESGVQVVLAKPDADIADLVDFDVVIGVDSSFSDSRVCQQLNSMQDDDPKPMSIHLVIAFGIEHFDLAIRRDIRSLDRKHALLVSMFESQMYLANHDGHYIDRMADEFVTQALNPDMNFAWDVDEIPAAFVDVWESTQRPAPTAEVTGSEMNGAESKKRKLDEADDGSVKRARRSPSARQISSLREMIHSQVAPDPSQSHIVMTQAAINAQSDKNNLLQVQLGEKEQLVEAMRKQIEEMTKTIKSHESTSNHIQQQHLGLLGERATFEKQCQAAQASEAKMKDRLTSVEAKTVDLESELKRVNDLRSASSEEVQSALRKKEEELEAANKRIQTLENTLKTRDDELSYARNVYQESSNASREAIQSTRALEEEVEKLRAQVKRDVARVHEIHTASAEKELQQLVIEAQLIAQDREAELDKAREELKTLKNGRRETRGSSVPRSPMMGVMSPRAPVSSRVPVSGAGTASRASSPSAPGGGNGGVFETPGGNGAPASFLNPPGSNGRFNHLKDF